MASCQRKLASSLRVFCERIWRVLVTKDSSWMPACAGMTTFLSVTQEAKHGKTIDGGVLFRIKPVGVIDLVALVGAASDRFQILDDIVNQPVIVFLINLHFNMGRGA